MTKRQLSRGRTLTDEDLIVLRELVKTNHVCRFENVCKEDVDFMKDLLNVYKETRSEVIKWIIKAIFYATGLLVFIYWYVKTGHKI